MTAQATSPFAQSARGTSMGWVSSVLAYDVSVLAATATITLTNFAVPVTKGRLRIKSSAVNGATVIAVGAIVGTDGTNTVTLSPALALAGAAGSSFDITQDIFSDLQLTSISVAVTLSGGTTIATVSTEFFGTP